MISKSSRLSNDPEFLQENCYGCVWVAFFSLVKWLHQNQNFCRMYLSGNGIHLYGTLLYKFHN
uniref:Uncharacterized protein n=1 Tax=Picea sitchensis TaxID=3332 RepID=A9P2H0_PICSI|nr:unknown [Picea sitchensis]